MPGELESYSQIQLARLAGVDRKTIAYQIRHKLRDAMTPDGTRIRADHPRVIAYVNSRHAGRKGAAARERRSTQVPSVLSVCSNVPSLIVGVTPDPFADAIRLATMPAQVGVTGSGSARGSAPTDLPQELPARPAGESLTAGRVERYAVGGGALPADLKDIRELTLGYVVDEWGSLPGLVEATKASKLFAEMKLKEVAASEKRGDLVARQLFTAVLIPFIDLAFKRLVGEAPGALREQIIARVMSGGADLAIDTETLIRDEISGILTNCRDMLLKELEAMG